jgi:predicted RNA-binding Zn ribbon-like protein
VEHEFLGGNLALDFTNTVHDHGADDPCDDLTTAAEWVEWAAQAKLLTGAEARELRRSHDEAHFQRALKLRELLYAILSGAADGKKPDAASLREFQALYREALRQMELRPTGTHYQLTWPAAISPLDRVLHEIVRAAGELLTSDALTRVHQCSGESCSWLFVDTSRNGMRRWCDMKACGNRDKVRRFRQRAVASD